MNYLKIWRGKSLNSRIHRVPEYVRTNVCITCGARHKNGKDRRCDVCEEILNEFILEKRGRSTDL